MKYRDMQLFMYKFNDFHKSMDLPWIFYYNIEIVSVYRRSICSSFLDT